MKKLLLFILFIPLTACGTDNADYIVNKTAFCSSVDENKSAYETKIVCKDVENNVISGRIVEYYDNGRIKRDFIVKDGVLDGEYKAYYDNKKLAVIQIFKQGVLHGMQKDFYMNGKLALEGVAKDGKRNGIYKTYHESGKQETERLYENGVLNGVQKDFYESGKLRLVTMYKNGKQDGEAKNYYESGQLRTEMIFKNDKPDGIRMDYDENGDLINEEKYKDGKRATLRLRGEEARKFYQKCLNRVHYCGKDVHEKGCRTKMSGEVYDIGRDGVVVKYVDDEYIMWGVHDIKTVYWFLYTDKKYAQGDEISSGTWLTCGKDVGNYFEYVGTYQYKTVDGGTNRLHAYKETQIPICYDLINVRDDMCKE